MIDIFDATPTTTFVVALVAVLVALATVAVAGYRSKKSDKWIRQTKKEMALSAILKLSKQKHPTGRQK